MKIPGLDEFLRKRARARLRHLMRGYRSLKKSGELRLIAAVKEALTLTPVFSSRGESDAISGLKANEYEVAVRQFLLVRLVGTGLGAALLRSIGKRNAPVVYPLPNTWRRVLVHHGFEVAETLSSFLWTCVVAMHFVSGIFQTIKLLIADAQNLFQPNGQIKRYVYFDALGLGNLPPTNAAGEKNDIVSWYLHWEGRVEYLDMVCHNVVNAGIRESGGTPVVPVASPLPLLADIRSLGRFLAACSFAIGKAFFSVIGGHWWYAMMLSETIKAFHIRVQDPALLARDYLFHNSNWIYRPLWTYDAERKGARILFYFYSTNIEQFKQSGVYPQPLYGWQTMTWSRYLVWDDYQETFLRRAVGNAAEVSVVGSISFHAGVPAPSDLPPLSIAVFDVQPMRDAVYQPLGIDFEYYVPRNANKFLVDIQEATRIAGHVMVFKRKRDVGTRVHPSYRRTMDCMNRTSNYLELDPDTSASALIERCQAVISAPFTSTALIGRELGKPSIFYDANGVCVKGDRAAHGIEIVSGEAELLVWIAKLESGADKTAVKAQITYELPSRT